MDSEKQARGSMSILFLVVLIDMIGFTLVIPFLTYFIQDLAQGDGFTDIGTRVDGLALFWQHTPLANFYSHRF